MKKNMFVLSLLFYLQVCPICEFIIFLLQNRNNFDVIYAVSDNHWQKVTSSFNHDLKYILPL